MYVENPQPPQQNPHQWRVVFYEAGDQPLVEVMRSFADAWAVAQPYPHEDGLPWVIGNRNNIKATLEVQAGPLTVASVDGQTYTTIERL
jgi:hypothetical protein